MCTVIVSARLSSAKRIPTSKIPSGYLTQLMQFSKTYIFLKEFSNTYIF